MPSRNGHNRPIPHSNTGLAAAFPDLSDQYTPPAHDSSRRRPSHSQNDPAMAPMSTSMHTGPPSGHNRSFSSPFNGLGKKKAAPKQAAWDSDSDSDDVTYTVHPLSANPRKNVSKGGMGSEFVEGKCQTCNSTVRWPRESQVFRCTTCLMVTDLDTELPKKAKDPEATDFTRLKGREKPLPPVPSEKPPPVPAGPKPGISITFTLNIFKWISN